MKFFYIILYTLILTGLQGCINDDTSGCPPGGYTFTLDFIYLGDGADDIFGEHITATDLYVFNSGGDLHSTYRLDRNDLARRQGASLDLEPGRYDIVAWGNAGQNTLIRQTGSTQHFSQYRVSHAALGSSTDINTYDRLYYAKDRVTVTSQNGHQTVLFRSANVGFEIFVTGLTDASTQPADFPSMDVGNVWSEYDFDMRYGPQSHMVPRVTATNKAETVYSGFHSLRFADHNDIEIKVSQRGGLMTAVKLAEFMASEGYSVDNTQEITIPIHVEFMNGAVTVSVVDWDSWEVVPDL